MIATLQLIQAKEAAAQELDDWLKENTHQPGNVRYAVHRHMIQLWQEVECLQRKIKEREVTP